MLKTIDGRTMAMVMKDIEEMSPFMLNEGNDKFMTFELDGSTSGYKGHEGENIWVYVDDIIVRLSGGGHEIKIPNYNHSSLDIMIKYAAELLWFQWDMVKE